MTSVKIKFYPPATENQMGEIHYQISANHSTTRMYSNIKVFEREWDDNTSDIIPYNEDPKRESFLKTARNTIRQGMQRLNTIILQFEQHSRHFTANDVAEQFAKTGMQNNMLEFVNSVVEKKKRQDKMRIAETYTSAIKSFIRFHKGRDIDICLINSDLMIDYEVWLRKQGVCANTSSFYMRNLRALYNKAVEEGLTFQSYPFRHVYTGIEKTVKRAVPLSIIKKIKEMNLPNNTASFARDMFLFSFYTRGMSFVDMAYLRKKDLAGGILTYRRSKTRQKLMIKWEPCMQEIANRYENKTSPYILPIIKCPFSDTRHQYLYTERSVNRALKLIGKILKLPYPLSTYVARHTWASVAHSKNIPISIISEGMGHNSETTTRIYLASLDNIAIDRANSMILNSI